MKAKDVPSKCPKLKEFMTHCMLPYYSSESFASVLVCSHCGCACDSSQDGQYPLCSDCSKDGALPLLKRKRKQLQFTPKN